MSSRQFKNSFDPKKSEKYQTRRLNNELQGIEAIQIMEVSGHLGLNGYRILFYLITKL